MLINLVFIRWGDDKVVGGLACGIGQRRPLNSLTCVHIFTLTPAILSTLLVCAASIGNWFGDAWSESQLQAAPISAFVLLSWMNSHGSPCTLGCFLVFKQMLHLYQHWLLISFDVSRFTLFCAPPLSAGIFCCYWRWNCLNKLGAQLREWNFLLRAL